MPLDLLKGTSLSAKASVVRFSDLGLLGYDLSRGGSRLIDAALRGIGLFLMMFHGYGGERQHFHDLGSSISDGQPL